MGAPNEQGVELLKKNMIEELELRKHLIQVNLTFL